MELHVYERDGRWCYAVGAVVQEWTPDVEGFVPMSEAEARTLGSEVLVRLTQHPEAGE